MKTTFANQGISGILMTLCGTHKGVQVGALACCDCSGPLFTTTLSQEASAGIEVRWCNDSDGEESGVEQLEIYIN